MKRAEEEEEYLGPDKLSSLPDALLIQILSFLDTKHAIIACFTIKKWVNLWTLLPDLVFRSPFFKSLSSFDKFVDKVLTLRDDSAVKINKFTYYRSNDSSEMPEVVESRLKRAVNFIVSHEIQDLSFTHLHCQIKKEGRVWAPLVIKSDSLLAPLVSCVSFKSLKLRYVSLDCNLCLNQVVTLYLERVWFTETGEETFSGCPNLKSLTLIDCPPEYLSGFCVSTTVVAPQLSKLTIERINASYGDMNVILSTPRLTSLKISTDSSVPFLQSDDLVHLDTVDVMVDVFGLDKMEIRGQFFKLTSMLKWFHNAKSVTLSSQTIKLLSMFPDELEKEPPPFCNVKLLIIAPQKGKPHTASSLALPGHVMTYLLGKSPEANTSVKFLRGLV